jgi:hypothetical protein
VLTVGIERPSLERTLNIIATAILPSILPFTLLVIKPVNDKLFAKAETLSLSGAGKSSDAKVLAKEEDKTNEEGTKALIERWTLLHLVWTGITGVGVGCVVWGVLGGERVL